VYEMK